MRHVITVLARECSSWHDDVWLVDSTPVECGRSRATQQRSDLAGWAAYGYCASHSRWFWGLRLHLITTPSGLPIAYALAPVNQDECGTCLEMIARAQNSPGGPDPPRRQGLPQHRISKPNSTTPASC